MSFSRRNFLKMSRHKRNQEEPFHAYCLALLCVQ